MQSINYKMDIYDVTTIKFKNMFNDVYNNFLSFYGDTRKIDMIMMPVNEYGKFFAEEIINAKKLMEHRKNYEHIDIILFLFNIIYKKIIDNDKRISREFIKLFIDNDGVSNILMAFYNEETKFIGLRCINALMISSTLKKKDYDIIFDGFNIIYDPKENKNLIELYLGIIIHILMQSVSFDLLVLNKFEKQGLPYFISNKIIFYIFKIFRIIIMRDSKRKKKYKMIEKIIYLRVFTLLINYFIKQKQEDIQEKYYKATVLEIFEIIYLIINHYEDNVVDKQIKTKILNTVIIKLGILGEILRKFNLYSILELSLIIDNFHRKLNYLTTYYSYVKGDTPLHSVIKLENKKAIYLILKNTDADMHKKNLNLETPLDVAIDTENEKIIIFLILLGATANVYKQDEYFQYYREEAYTLKNKMNIEYGNVLTDILRDKKNFDDNISFIISDKTDYGIEEYKKILLDDNYLK